MRIKWLHLSDIHFNYKNYASNELRDDFIQRMSRIGKSEGFTHLFLSGDILNKNQMVEDDTVEFIKNLMKALGLTRDKVFVVPGNHDHDRAETIRGKAVPFFNVDPTDFEKQIDVVDNLSDSDIESLLKSFDNFGFFYQATFDTDYYTDLDNPHQIRNDGDLTVVSLNTAWLDVSSDDHANILCGSRKLQHILKENHEALNNHLNIAIGHHPLENMAPPEQKRLLDQFTKHEICLYLCGHTHKPAISYFRDHQVLQLVCPGGYSDGYSEGGYVIGVMDTDADVYKAEFYCWNDGNWCIDSCVTGTDERGILYFNLNQYKHQANICAVDLKLFDGHIPRESIERALGDDNFDTYIIDIPDTLSWEVASSSINLAANDIVHLVEANASVHIFPIAPISLLIELGYELQDNFPLHIHQYDREIGKWVKEGHEIFDYDTESNACGNSELAIIISTSFPILVSSIEKVLGGKLCDTISFVSKNPGVGLPLYSGTTKEFAKTVFAEINKVIGRYDHIHLFAAVPAGLAIELGRQMLKSVYFNVHLYNYSKGQYEHSFVLNPTE